MSNRIVESLPRDWTFGEKVLQYPKHVARRIGVPSDKSRVVMDVVKFVPEDKVFHGYIVDSEICRILNGRRKQRLCQRRIWVTLAFVPKEAASSTSRKYTILRAGIVRTERRIRFSPFCEGKSSLMSVNKENEPIYAKIPTLMHDYRAKKKRKRTVACGTVITPNVTGTNISKRTRASSPCRRDHSAREPVGSKSSTRWMCLPFFSSSPAPHTSPVQSSDTDVKEIRTPIVGANDVEEKIRTPPIEAERHVGKNRESGFEVEDIEKVLTPVIPASTHADATEDVCEEESREKQTKHSDLYLFKMLQGIVSREREERAAAVASVLSRQTHRCHDVVDVSALGDSSEAVEALRTLAIENFETTGSIPFPKAPLPAIGQSVDMFAKWRSKRQRVALLRCRCNSSTKPKWIGYIAWIEFVSTDCRDCVVPPVISQIFVTASHRGSGSHGGGNFGKLMFEWVVSQIRFSCRAVAVASPNEHSRRMLAALGWHEASLRPSLHPCAVADRVFFVRLRSGPEEGAIATTEEATEDAF